MQRLDLFSFYRISPRPEFEVRYINSNNDLGHFSKFALVDAVGVLADRAANAQKQRQAVEFWLAQLEIVAGYRSLRIMEQTVL